MRKILFTAILALLTTACQVQVSIGANINADGSGTIIYEIGLDELAVQVIPESFFDDPISGSPLALIPGAELTEESRDGFDYHIVTVEVDDIAAALDDVIAGSDRAIVEEFRLTITDDRVEVAARADAGAAFAGSAGMMSPEQLAEAVTASVVLTLPGEILEHDADSVDGNTLTWTVSVEAGEITEINAASNPAGSGDGGFPYWLIVVIAAVVVLALAVAFLSRLSKAPEQPDEPPPLDQPTDTE